jgi:transposase
MSLDTSGKILGDHPFPASSHGYRDALDWLAKFGLIDKIGVESTGSYAAGITRFLLESCVDVVEVNQPHPHLRARRGKDDSIDAEAAARKTLSGQATAAPAQLREQPTERSAAVLVARARACGLIWIV